MKQQELIKIITTNGAVFLRHGGNHDVYYQPRSGKQEVVPRHREISEPVAKNIIKNLL